MLLIIPALVGTHGYSLGDLESGRSQTVAYVAFDAAGPGSLADSSDPFPSFTAALAAGADELRIKIGIYTENVHVATGDVKFRSWNGVSGAGELLDVVDRVEIVGNLRMGQYSVEAANITLVGNGVTFAATSFTLENGTLDIGNNILNHHATNPISNLLFLRDQAEIVALDVGGKSTPELARIEVTGEEFARWFFETFGAAVVKTVANLSEGVTFRIEANGNDRENQLTVQGYVQKGGRVIIQRSISVLTSLREFRIESGQLNADGADVDIFNDLDILESGELFTGGGDLNVSGNLSNRGGTLSTFTGTASVGGGYFQDRGETSTTGGDFEVVRDFNMGDPVTLELSDGEFSLNFEGTLTIFGGIYVGPDQDSSEQPNQDADARNHFKLGGTCSGDPADGGLILFGNYHFEGTGDRFDDNDWLPEEQGLRGSVFFVGATEQTVWHREDEDANFCSVIMAGTGDPDDGIVLLSDVWQNDAGTLTLEHGII
ncbi:MAG: hypothetical protein IH853_08090, partial [Bacteroidetes bacterium]|nr:hypothetical protein [Bacteroidota bacterium]